MEIHHIFVEVSGFEPELGEPKSPVLPLHHTSIFAENGGIEPHPVLSGRTT